MDTQPCTRTVTLPSTTNSMESVLQSLEAEMEVETDEGYTGTLKLDHTSVHVTVDGYKSSTKNHSATRTFPNLSEADLSLLPKTVTEGGRTLSLATVQWSSSYDDDGEGGAAIRYSATASYTGSSTTRYATGYTITADYTGEVAKTGCEIVTYTAIFGSRTVSEEPENSGVETVPAAKPEPAANSPASAPVTAAGLLTALGCMAAVAIPVAAVIWLACKLMGRMGKK